MEFRENTWDKLIWDSVYNGNEYNLPDRIDGWNVVDIGGHIGSFAKLALDRGAEKVNIVEANPNNIPILMNNLKEHANCTIFPFAVYGDEFSEIRDVSVHWSEFGNTGGSSVFFKGNTKTNVIILQKVLDDMDKVDLMKIDCEGSEYHILHSGLEKVKRICGEYHEDPELLNLISSNLGVLITGKEFLFSSLRVQGFKNITDVPHKRNPYIGNFFASRE